MARILDQAHDFHVDHFQVFGGHPLGNPLEKLESRVAAAAIHDSAERYDAPKCHPETRVAVQDDLYEWIVNDDGVEEHPRKLKWVTGPAGTGKTAVMGSLADRCSQNGVLGATFFFASWSASVGRRRKTAFVSTIAHQLTEYREDVKNAISSAIERNPSVFEKNLRVQMEVMILAPLREVVRQSSETERLKGAILVDGVDECEAEQYHDTTRTGQWARPKRRDAEDQLEILQVLHAASSDPSFPFRIIVASRPERVFREFFDPERNPISFAQKLDLHEDYNADADIALFLKAQLNQIRRRYNLLASWPPPGAIETLVERASGQFIYAATVVRFLEMGHREHPKALLDAILRMSASQEATSNALEQLDALYTHILESSPDPALSVQWIYAIYRCSTHAIQAIPSKVCVASNINSLLQTDPESNEAEHVLGNLHSLIRIPAPDALATTRYDFYHKSLIDFLSSNHSGNPGFNESGCKLFLWESWDRFIRACTRGSEMAESPFSESFLNFLACLPFDAMMWSTFQRSKMPLPTSASADWWVSLAVARKEKWTLEEMFQKIHVSSPWNSDVSLSRWNELGFNNKENKRDHIHHPHLRIYGDHHLIFTITNNYWETLPPAINRPEVRERAFQQALEVLQFDPERAKVEKLKWFRLPPPDDIWRKPVTFPHIYCEGKRVFPELIREILDGIGASERRLDSSVKKLLIYLTPLSLNVAICLSIVLSSCTSDVHPPLAVTVTTIACAHDFWVGGPSYSKIYHPLTSDNSYEELFPPTYRFDELPPPWPAAKGYETPIYILGWLVRVGNARLRFGGYHSPWNSNVALARWIELGLTNAQNKQDCVSEPSVTVYGEHHFLFTISDNYYERLPPMRSPEVRERAFEQALQVLQLDPKRATVEKVRWFRALPPRDILKKPVTFPHIYCEQKHIFPELIKEMMDGSWKKRYPSQVTPGALRFSQFRREQVARKHNFQVLGGDIFNGDPSTKALEKLKAQTAPAAIHDSRERCDAPKCHLDTRVAVQDDLNSWIVDEDVGGESGPPKKIKWVTGPAGTGKTAVMGSLSERCKAGGVLAATFFFASWSTSVGRRRKAFLVTTIAHQLARYHPDLRVEIAKAIEMDSDIFDKGLQTQMEALILNPLQEIACRPDRPLLRGAIIIDGVDECEAEWYSNGPKSKPGQLRRNDEDQREILQVLQAASSSPFFPFRIIIASRPEPVFREFFDHEDNVSTFAPKLDLHEEYNADADITLFLKAQFNILRRRYNLSPSWPPPDTIQTLVKNASGQFIYAATVIRFLDMHHQQPLKVLLDVILKGGKAQKTPTNALEMLDALYTHILNSSPDPLLSAKVPFHMR
ncbi:hypothetical protein MD484_g2859, partial [Candolleomyces efflorescens]